MRVDRVACIGSGLIGSGWAVVFASKGLEVRLHDVSESKLKGALSVVREKLEFLARNRLIPGGVEELIERVSASTDLREAVEDADYIQESVPEDYGAKRRAFAEISKWAPRDAIIASSTSALLISKIQRAARGPERCLTAHPWNPVYLIPLVELVPGELTSKSTVEAARGFMEGLGKAPVVLRRDVPGHLANRLQAAILREAMDLVDKGIATVGDVDKAVRLGPGLRWALMGPFMIFHLAGGEGGMRRSFDILGPSYELRWRSMSSWTSIPPSARRKALRQMGALLKGKGPGGLPERRDEALVKLLRALWI
ncbi:MAG: 3-hydroxyacyl-CoA dehydrogenase NAD-binding domain-containing protein [Candidatus Bathyarchaeia archaeon]